MVKISTNDVSVRVEMLGGFAIVSDGNRITEQEKRSSKIWKLLQYLVVNRHKTVSQEELMDVFFDSDFVGNPGSSVRTMVYRARSALAAGGFAHADDIILSGNGGYRWNTTLRCLIDIEEFESLCKRASNVDDLEERTELLMQAAELYRGDFLPSSASELWVMPLARWYRSLYFNCVHEALALLFEAGRNDEASELCVRALRLDPFDELILEYHLRSLMALGKSAEALDEYNKMETMFYDEMGIDFSEGLRALYQQIQQPEVKEGLSLEDTLESWLKGADFPGAYYCDLSVFKIVYQLESRSTSRSGRATYIVRFDTKHDLRTKDGGVMMHLGKAISETLRKGDLYTRSSPNQYMLMLHKLTYENCKMLVNRILRGVDSKYLPKVIGTSIKPITPML
ncbi:MAG: winged helix-turn-helix domain-containing protein [Oscillospiraceae bacterium]|nr:winged helix-turn-helix domain-containing protein [Oscillospiraceae bacterium]